jgi:hypothetical protein
VTLDELAAMPAGQRITTLTCGATEREACPSEGHLLSNAIRRDCPFIKVDAAANRDQPDLGGVMPAHRREA